MARWPALLMALAPAILTQVALDGPGGDRLTECVGSALYMAPEVEQEAPYGVAADIFSFGITICEALTAKEAQDIINETRTNAFGLNAEGLKSFLDPQRQPAACYDLVDLASACCQLDATARPDVTDVLSTLERIRAEFTVQDDLSA